jgi:hypothetical protein
MSYGVIEVLSLGMSRMGSSSSRGSGPNPSPWLWPDASLTMSPSKAAANNKRLSIAIDNIEDLAAEPATTLAEFPWRGIAC